MSSTILGTCRWACLVTLVLAVSPSPSHSAPEDEVLVAAGSDWTHLDDGSDQGTEWREVGFDDSAWKSGPAELGYGDGDEATTVDYGTKRDKHITTYFRHAFSLAEVPDATELALRLKRDDGAVVYINGTEVFRSNMPNGLIGFDTLASKNAGGTEAVFIETIIAASHLQVGTNVVAVEVHKNKTKSPDLSFDFELITIGVAPPPPPPPDPEPEPGTLVATGSTWRYLDNGTDPGGAWVLLDFADSAWKQGVAQLGYGDGDEATVVSFGPDSGSKYITTYFRRKFDVTDVTNIAGLTLRLLRDDGAIVFLNGTEITRSNMPDGPITFLTTASSSVDDAESTFVESSPDVGILRAGENVLAVEIHQHSGSSPDISFDLELLADLQTPPEPPPEPPPPVTGSTLIAEGAVWRYLDDGSDQGTGWRGVGFSDSSWASGPAQLGYGDGDEATVVSYGPNASDKHITTYFRHAFSLTEVPEATDLTLRLKRDDGGVVYLNGTEVFRSNMPSGAIGFETVASSNAGDTEDQFIEAIIGASHLQVGTNVVAVEIHQAGPGSSDISFDFALRVGAAAPIVPLIAAGSTWKYLDDGTDQGTAWRDINFEDGSWNSGLAELGYGDGDEATVVNYGSNSRDKHITTYFRHKFAVTELPWGLILKLKRDDGAVVYLNGTEVFRSNMPSGTIDFQTTTSGSAGSTENVFLETTVDPSLVRIGDNVVAVEVHQHKPNSSDLSFDLELSEANSGGEILTTRGPYLQMATDTAITIRWRSNGPTDSRVMYGTSASSLDLVKDDATVTTEHEVRLTGLSAGTKYWYSVGSTTAVLATGSGFHFTTHPEVGTAKPTRIWVIGDSGQDSTNSRAVRDAFKAYAGDRLADVWLTVGDNAYSDGTDSDYQKNFFDLYPVLLQKIPVWPALGNHDIGPYYFDIFTLPTNAEAGGLASDSEQYYSFDYADIHFIAIDSDRADPSPSGAMATWIRNDLAATTQRWRIAYFHQAPYTRGSHNSDWERELIDMREIIVPILEAGGIDLVLCGHSHVYERSFLLDGHYGDSTTFTEAMKVDGGDGRATGDGIYTKTSGANKGAVYVVCGSSARADGGSLDHPAMFIGMNRLGSVVIDIDGGRLDLKFLRDTGVIDDWFTIAKD